MISYSHLVGETSVLQGRESLKGVVTTPPPFDRRRLNSRKLVFHEILGSFEP